MKPENILTDLKRNAYVADFGVSSILADKRGVALGSRVGTMAFMSPELIASASAATDFGKEADIWAFGVSFYCLVYGRLPFNGRTAPELVRAITCDPVPFPEKLPEVSMTVSMRQQGWQALNPSEDSQNVEREVRQLIERLLAKDPKERMSLREFRRHPFVRQYAASPSEVEAHGADLRTEGSGTDIETDREDETKSHGRPSEQLAEVTPLGLPTPSQPTPPCATVEAKATVPTKPTAPHHRRENPRHLRANVTGDEVKNAVSRCAVGMYHRKRQTSTEAQAVVGRFVNKFRSRIHGSGWTPVGN